MRLARGEARRVDGRDGDCNDVVVEDEGAVTAHSFPQAAWSWLKSRSRPLGWYVS